MGALKVVRRLMIDLSDPMAKRLEIQEAYRKMYSIRIRSWVVDGDF